MSTYRLRTSFLPVVACIAISIAITFSMVRPALADAPSLDHEKQLKEEVRLVWSQFLAALKDDDPERAVSLIRPGAQENSRTWFRELGSELHTLPASWSALEFVYVSNNYVEAAIQQGTGDNAAILVISFVRMEADGRWVIGQF